jgi:nitroreductase
MDALEAIHTRRSIRQYQDRPIPDEVIEQLLAAAMAAPSARNAQAWQFIVLTDRGLLGQIPGFCPNAPMAAAAPAAILVCGDLGLELSPGYWVIDCAAACQNLLLAAHALGLGACWCGVHPRQPRVEGFRRLFHLPDNTMPHSLIVLGYPAEQHAREDRYRADRVRRNGW